MGPAIDEQSAFADIAESWPRDSACRFRGPVPRGESSDMANESPERSHASALPNHGGAAGVGVRRCPTDGR